jgi:K+-sensing histidine kinase KdpD
VHSRREEAAQSAGRGGRALKAEWASALAICKSIIVAQGGDIAVANHPDGGAQFRLSLPAVPQSMISSEARLLMPNPPMPA